MKTIKFFLIAILAVIFNTVSSAAITAKAKNNKVSDKCETCCKTAPGGKCENCKGCTSGKCETRCKSSVASKCNACCKTAPGGKCENCKSCTSGKCETCCKSSVASTCKACCKTAPGGKCENCKSCASGKCETCCKSGVSSNGKSSIKTNELLKNETFNLKVSGNCEMCKARIEKAVKVAGVTKADWNIKTKLLTLSYYLAKVKSDDIEKKIAAVGHDTPKYKALTAKYNTLPGCCKYR